MSGAGPRFWSPGVRIALAGLVVLGVAAIVTGFVWLPQVHPDFTRDGLWDAICRAAGVPRNWSTARAVDDPQASRVAMVPALTGTILCIGIATANSILVINTAREAHQAGQPPLAAALEAGFSRFRPVLMTALAMLIGMLPMALGLGDGGEQNAPLGRAVIGGLALGTMSTLLFVPVVYGMVHAWLDKRRAARSEKAESAVPARTL